MYAVDTKNILNLLLKPKETKKYLACPPATDSAPTGEVTTKNVDIAFVY